MINGQWMKSKSAALTPISWRRGHIEWWIFSEHWYLIKSLLFQWWAYCSPFLDIIAAQNNIPSFPTTMYVVGKVVAFSNNIVPFLENNDIQPFSGRSILALRPSISTTFTTEPVGIWQRFDELSSLVVLHRAPNQYKILSTIQHVNSVQSREH